MRLVPVTRHHHHDCNFTRTNHSEMLGLPKSAPVSPKHLSSSLRLTSELAWHLRRVGGSSMPTVSSSTYRSSGNGYSSSESRPTTTSRVMASDYPSSGQYSTGSSRVIRDPKDWAQYEGANAGLFSYPPMADSYPGLSKAPFQAPTLMSPSRTTLP
eukprot:3093251-Rhodomonas_salina.1